MMDMINQADGFVRNSRTPKFRAPDYFMSIPLARWKNGASPGPSPRLPLANHIRGKRDAKYGD
jgi:hypothetical protein